jgi:hypothetical protein
MTAAYPIMLAGRPLAVTVSPAAAAALAGRSTPLVVECELYFSCLIRKRVQILDAPRADTLCTVVDDRLTVCFRPVMTRACAVDAVAGQPELETFPIRRPEAFVPRWLRLDWRHGGWQGEFGY